MKLISSNRRKRLSTAFIHELNLRVYAYHPISVADPDFELRRGPGFHSLAQPAFLPSVNREVKFDVYGKRQTAKIKLAVCLQALYSRIKIFVFAVNSKAAFIMYATGGGRGFFFQRLVFLYPPQGPYKFSEPPKQSAEKLIPPLPPPPSQEISK